MPRATGTCSRGSRSPTAPSCASTSTETFDDLPADLDLKRADDQILALACSYNRRPGVKTTLVTNDLNLLLRGQALGLESYRFEGKLEHIRERRRTPLEWLRANRLTLALVVLVVFFAGTTAFFAIDRPVVSSPSTSPFVDDATLLQSLGVSPQFLEAQYRNAAREEPRATSKALTNLANVLYDQQRYLEAVSYYRQVLDLTPTNANVRTDMGIAQLKLGHDGRGGGELPAGDRGRARTWRCRTTTWASRSGSRGDLTDAILELKTAVQLGQKGGGTGTGGHDQPADRPTRAEARLDAVARRRDLRLRGVSLGWPRPRGSGDRGGCSILH